MKSVKYLEWRFELVLVLLITICSLSGIAASLVLWNVVRFSSIVEVFVSMIKFGDYLWLQIAMTLWIQMEILQLHLTFSNGQQMDIWLVMLYP